MALESSSRTIPGAAASRSSRPWADSGGAVVLDLHPIIDARHHVDEEALHARATHAVFRHNAPPGSCSTSFFGHHASMTMQ